MAIILPTGLRYAPSADINEAWYCLVLHGIEWYLHGIACYCIALHCFVWCCMVLHGIAWYCLVLRGIAWYYIILHGIARQDKKSRQDKKIILHGIAC